MTKVIAVSGKGGVGKTLVSALLIRHMVNAGVRNILAIDADPDENLASALGAGFDKTVGDIREGLLNVTLPPGVEKMKYLDSKVFEITVEAGDFDLLVMGRPEGPGCYCAVNHMLREIIDNAAKSYDYVVIDTEAGLEHLSRRTTQNVDVMLVVTDASRKGFETASRIKDLAGEVGIGFEQVYLILNRVRKEDRGAMKKMADSVNLEIIGEIPEDGYVRRYDLEGKALFDLPEESGAYAAAGEMIDKII
ncbi:MAG: ATP-binding protein [Candidatus Altiarchaeales archaeon WOR_SM1_86-2]|nr:MAG: ATP-binding protein [Candidatus Altiarchaeales archaeon WOR_SM1_86-2]